VGVAVLEPPVVEVRPADSPRGATPGPARGALLMLAPALTLWMAFHRGGFPTGTTGLAAAIACGVLLIVVLADPAARLGRSGAIGVAALAAFAGWGLLSATWSDATPRALYELDRLLLYAAVFAIYAMAPDGAAAARWLLRGFAAVFVLICAAGLASRLVPDVVAPAGIDLGDRLDWPLGYWNAVGLTAALAIVLCVHLSAAPRESRVVRAAAAAAVPIVVSALYLSLSRGGFLALIVGLAALLMLGRTGGLVGTALALVPTGVAALLLTVAADGLTTTFDPERAASIHAGHLLAVELGLLAAIAALVRLGAGGLDRRWPRRAGAAWTARRRRCGLAVGLAVALLALIGVGGPSGVADQWRDFASSAPVADSLGAGRLAETSANGRVDHWRVAWGTFVDHPLAGSGSGTYRYEWTERRSLDYLVSDAHSLYLEVLAELGLVGALLLGIALLVPLRAALARRGADRLLWAAVGALVVAWLVHAATDWDWEMPASTVPIVALLGAACAGGRASPSVRRPRRRVVIAVALAVVAAIPVRVALSQHALDRADAALLEQDCGRAADAARSARAALPERPEPYEILGYCDARAGRFVAAERMLAAAVRRDPRNWEPYYGLALVRAAGGRDPRPAIAQGLRRNPDGPDLRRARRLMASSSPRDWRARVGLLPLVVATPVDPLQAGPGD
jgi:hypothetical protein